MIAAVRAELGPNLGLVELREPTEADARITELETAITVRDTEIARLETDLELARIGSARYEFVRMLTPRTFGEIWNKSMISAAQFDELVDAARGGS